MKLLLATRSAHKAREVARILRDAGGGDLLLATLEDASIPWSPVEESLEPFDTFEENAASKARYFARLSGLPTVADDSGLEVDALGGRPGVRTKRFAPRERYPDLGRDEANNRYLIERLETRARRGARGAGTCAWPASSTRSAARPRSSGARHRGESSVRAAGPVASATIPSSSTTNCSAVSPS